VDIFSFLAGRKQRQRQNCEGFPMTGITVTEEGHVLHLTAKSPWIAFEIGVRVTAGFISLALG
jgi:hypothetical protein